MAPLKLFKRFLIPASAVFGMQAIAGQVTLDPNAEIKRCAKPSELPIYLDNCYTCPAKPCDKPSALERHVGQIRKEVWAWVDVYNGYSSRVIEVWTNGKEHFESTMGSLREESNYLPRAGAIGLSGLTGVVFGLRGGLFRKLTYGTMGAGAMAAFCYPREAVEYADLGLHYAKKYIRVGYNFMYGVKPDYIKLPEPAKFLPEEVTLSKSSSLVAHVVDESVHLSVAQELTATEQAEDMEKIKRAKRDQSKPEDRDLYSNRSK